MNDQVPEPRIDFTAANGLTELEAHVQCRLAGQIHDFRLVGSENGIVLRGQAHTYHVKQLAQHIVMEAAAIPIVANDIEVS